MSAGDAKNGVPGAVKSKMTKVTRVEIFFVELGSFFRSPHHVSHPARLDLVSGPPRTLRKKIRTFQEFQGLR